MYTVTLQSRRNAHSEWRTVRENAATTNTFRTIDSNNPNIRYIVTITDTIINSPLKPYSRQYVVSPRGALLGTQFRNHFFRSVEGTLDILEFETFDQHRLLVIGQGPMRLGVEGKQTPYDLNGLGVEVFASLVLLLGPVWYLAGTSPINRKGTHYIQFTGDDDGTLTLSTPNVGTFNDYQVLYLIPIDTQENVKNYKQALKKLGLEHSDKGWFDPNESVKVYVSSDEEAYRYFNTT